MPPPIPLATGFPLVSFSLNQIYRQQGSCLGSVCSYPSHPAGKTAQMCWACGEVDDSDSSDNKCPQLPGIITVGRALYRIQDHMEQFGQDLGLQSQERPGSGFKFHFCHFLAMQSSTKLLNIPRP